MMWWTVMRYIMIVISACILMCVAWEVTRMSVRRFRERRDDKLSRQSEAFAARGRAAELVLKAPDDAKLMRRFAGACAGLSDGQCLVYDAELQTIRDEYGEVMGLYSATAVYDVVIQTLEELDARFETLLERMSQSRPRERVAWVHEMLTKLGPRVERLETQFRLDNAHVSTIGLTGQMLSKLSQKSSDFLETDAVHGVLDRAEERCRLASEYVDNAERVVKRYDKVLWESSARHVARAAVRATLSRKHGLLRTSKEDESDDEMRLFRRLLDGRHTPEEVERRIIEQCQRYSIDL